MYTSSSSNEGSFLFLERCVRSNLFGLLLNSAGLVIMAAYKIARGRELLFGMTPWKGWPLKTNPVAGRNLVGTVHITINLAALQFLSMSENIVGLCKWFAVTRVLSNRRCRGAGRGSSPGASGRLGCFLLGPT